MTVKGSFRKDDRIEVYGLNQSLSEAPEPTLGIVYRTDDDGVFVKFDSPVHGIPEAWIGWATSGISFRRPEGGTSGVRCSGCQLVNEFATPNRPDGSYLCYNCR